MGDARLAEALRMAAGSQVRYRVDSVLLVTTGGLGVRWRATDSLAYSSSVSSQMVKGPSFTSDTSIIAANSPVSTRGTSLRA